MNKMNPTPITLFLTNRFAFFCWNGFYKPFYYKPATVPLGVFCDSIVWRIKGDYVAHLVISSEKWQLVLVRKSLITTTEPCTDRNQIFITPTISYQYDDH